MSRNFYRAESRSLNPSMIIASFNRRKMKSSIEVNVKDKALSSTRHERKNRNFNGIGPMLRPRRSRNVSKSTNKSNEQSKSFLGQRTKAIRHKGIA